IYNRFFRNLTCRFVNIPYSQKNKDECKKKNYMPSLQDVSPSSKRTSKNLLYIHWQYSLMRLFLIRNLRRRERPLVPAHAGMSVSEAWKGGDAEAWAVELAKQEKW
ncbi:MAG: hypothetical protein J6S81_06490, partial [Treponema sp.]|nr:hypothetical protein [Treponema sp.]